MRRSRQTVDRTKRRAGVTLVEVLVVVAVAAIVLALLAFAVQRVRESANRVSCINNLHQIGLACARHHELLGLFPDAGGYSTTPRTFGSNNIPRTAPHQEWGWAYQILPYLDQKDLWAHPSNAAVVAAVIPGYFCPSRRSPVRLYSIDCGVAPGLRGGLDYAGNGGSGPGRYYELASGSNQTGLIVPRTALWGGPRIDHDEIPDGLSNTLLVGERSYNLARYNDSSPGDENQGYIASYGWDSIRWAIDPAKPPDAASGFCGASPNGGPQLDTRDDRYCSRRFGGPHVGGCLFVFVDGSVRPVAYDVDFAAFRKMAHRKDGVGSVEN